MKHFGNVITLLPADPHYISFFKPNYSWPVIHLVVSDQGYHTFLYRYTKHNQEGGRKRTNEQTRTWASSKRKKEGVCDSVYSLCICRLSRACILHKTFTKATNNADIFSRWLTQLCRSTGLISCLSDFCWLSSLPCFHLLLPPSADCLILWTAISCWLSSSALRCQLALSVFSRTFLPSSTSDLAGDFTLSPLCGFCTKTEKEIVWVAPAQTETNCYASCHRN